MEKNASTRKEVEAKLVSAKDKQNIDPSERNDSGIGDQSFACGAAVEVSRHIFSKK